MTNVEALKELYEAFDGESADVANAVTIVDVLNVISVLFGGAGGATTNADAIANITAVASTIHPDTPTTQNVEVTPTTELQTVTADTGKVLGTVTVKAVTAAIDANIVAGNIKDGVTILGVTGSYSG